MEYILGSIDFDHSSEDLITEALGKININDAGLCVVKVKGNEGQIPHLHIEGDNFVCHVCLLECLYFEHKSGESKLNKKDKKTFNKFMAAKNKRFKNKTNWEEAIDIWISANDNEGFEMERFIESRKKKGKHPSKDVQPDYTKLDNSKEGSIHEPKK